MADSQVSDFMAFSGCNDPAAAAQYLEVASGNLEHAVQLFMADDPNPINPNPINYKTNILSIFQTSQPLCNMCNLPATLICNDCRLVFYCCSDCAAYGAAAHSNVCDLLQERCLVNDDYDNTAQAFNTIMEDISDLFDLSPKTYNQRHDSEILVDLLGCCRRRFTCHIFPQLLRGLFENLDCISNGKEEVRLTHDAFLAMQEEDVYPPLVEEFLDVLESSPSLRAMSLSMNMYVDNELTAMISALLYPNENYTFFYKGELWVLFCAVTDALGGSGFILVNKNELDAIENTRTLKEKTHLLQRKNDEIHQRRHELHVLTRQLEKTKGNDEVMQGGGEHEAIDTIINDITTLKHEFESMERSSMEEKTKCVIDKIIPCVVIVSVELVVEQLLSEFIVLGNSDFIVCDLELDRRLQQEKDKKMDSENKTEAYLQTQFKIVSGSVSSLNTNDGNNNSGGSGSSSDGSGNDSNNGNDGNDSNNGNDETKSDQGNTPEQILLDAQLELANAEALTDSDPDASLAAFDALLHNQGTSSNNQSTHGFLFYSSISNSDND